MYLGEVNVLQEKLSSLIKAAECLRIRGLAVPDEDPPAGVRESSSREKRSGSFNEAGPEGKRRKSDEPNANKSKDVNSRDNGGKSSSNSQSGVNNSNVNSNKDNNSVNICNKDSYNIAKSPGHDRPSRNSSHSDSHRSSSNLGTSEGGGRGSGAESKRNLENSMERDQRTDENDEFEVSNFLKILYSCNRQFLDKNCMGLKFSIILILRHSK